MNSRLYGERVVKKDNREDGLARRFARFARVSAGLGGVAARGAARSLSGTKMMSAANAADLTAVLGNLRGPVMKVAQFVATVPGVLPPEVAAPLLSLQTSAPPMGAAFVRRRMIAELGADWEKKFKSFDREAAHAASLGQVHKAVAKDGTALACKLQYPDMGAAVGADIRQLKAALSIQRGFDSTIDTREFGQEIEARLKEELDYVREAAHMKLYGIMLKDRQDIAVPAPFPQLSTKRLLTMTWLDGKPILEFEDAAQKTRDAISTALFKAWWRPFARYGAIHGDPHLGNYAVRADGGINLMDFGCVRTFRPQFVEGVIGLYHALQKRDDALAAKAYRAWGFAKVTPEMVGVLNLWARFILTPLLDDRVRLVDDGVPAAEYGLKQANDVHEKLKAMGGIRPPREFVFMDRAAIGLGGALIRMGARLNFHKLFEEEIADFDVAALEKRQRAAFKETGVPLPEIE
ncbi:MAG TPA: AarF/ABC1/UbiB kinase family protein [Rhizomicrobium sp.]|jgi:predicted unusual protein kinase regulating ubiquinone biosynthesis (AarF/ABC1/UbiB family)|nr:AarF/ABC1/UbiB kinase family protein [Rhizomicrobium sp.]